MNNPTGRLDKRYDSRSRFFLETERIAKEHEIRTRLHTEQQEALAGGDSDSEPKLPEPGVLPDTFATIDTDRRDRALGLLNVQTLVRATAAVEEEANKPKPMPVEIIQNSAATGLQALAAAMEFKLEPEPSANTANGPLGPMLPPYSTFNEGRKVSTDRTDSSFLNGDEGKGIASYNDFSPPSQLTRVDVTPQKVSGFHQSPSKPQGSAHSRHSSTYEPTSTFSPCQESAVSNPSRTVQNGQHYVPINLQNAPYNYTGMPNQPAQHDKEPSAGKDYPEPEAPPQDHHHEVPSRSEHSNIPALKLSLRPSIYEQQTSHRTNRRGSEPALRYERNEVSVESRSKSRSFYNSASSLIFLPKPVLLVSIPIRVRSGVHLLSLSYPLMHSGTNTPLPATISRETLSAFFPAAS